MKQRVDEEAKLSNFMHKVSEESTDHEKQGLLSVMQDDRNVPITIDTAVTGSHHEVTISEPLIQPTSGNTIFEWRMENSSTTAKIVRWRCQQMLHVVKI